MIRNAAIAGAVALGAVGVGVGWTVQQNVLADEGSVGGVVDVPEGSALDRDGDGAVSDAELAAGPPTAVYFDCPGGTALGSLHDGDRILSVGTHESAEGWLALRRPLAPSETVWMASAQIVPDDDLDELPAMACASGDALQLVVPESPEDETDDEVEDEPDTTEVAAPDTTTSTRPSSNTTATTRPTATSTTKPDTTTTSTSPSTTAAPAPTLSVLAPSPTAISELRGDGNPCASGPTAKTSLVRATSTNADSVTMSWSVAGDDGQKAMSNTSGDLWQVVLGSFGQNTLGSGTATIQVTIRATGPGGTRTANTSVTLHNCAFFG